MKIQKKNKFWFYLQGYARFLCQKKEVERKIKSLEKKLSASELEKIHERVDYYCKVSQVDFSNFQRKIKDLKRPKTPKAYYFDTYEYARYFSENQSIGFVFGDVIHIPDTPSIVKSRPISKENQNSVLLNLDKARHFVWVKGDKPFSQKQNKLIGRGAVFQKHRIDFYEKYFSHPLCDLGQVNNAGGNPLWMKPKISIEKHLDYKFILSLQGNDVATNLKWILSSDSVAVMPKPTLETWFMEGKLQGGVHFIEIKPDYSDLEERLQFYIENPLECEKIIQNAHQHCALFFNKNAEDLCSLLVLKKYFGV